MKRLALLLLGTLALASLLSANAQAQAIQPPLVVKRDGKQLTNQPAIYATVDDCNSNAEFEFAIDYTAQAPIVEAWQGVGTVNCADPNNRIKSTASATAPVCKLLGTDTDATSTPRIKVKAKDLFSKVQGATNAECDMLRNQAYTVYIIPLAQPTDPAGNMAYAAQTIGGITTRTVTFTLYTLPSDAPVGISGLRGESRLGVKFTVIQGAQAKTRYKAYFNWGTSSNNAGGDDEDAGADEDASTELDAGAGDDTDAGADAGTGADTGTDNDADAGETSAPAACGSGALRENQPPPAAGTKYVAGVTTNSSPVYLEDLDSHGVAVGDVVAAAVVTVDAAGNESNLSKVICIERVETGNFLENCKHDPDCKDGFSSCSLSPAAGAGGLVGVGLLGLAIAFALRRRSRA